MNEIGYLVAGLLITLGFLFLVWLLLREVFCWYFKINNFLSILNEFNDNFKILSGEFLHYLKTQNRILEDQHDLDMKKFESENGVNNTDDII